MKTFKKKLLKNKKHNSYKKNRAGGANVLFNIGEKMDKLALVILVSGLLGITVLKGMRSRSNNNMLENQIQLINDIKKNPSKFNNLKPVLQNNETLVIELLIANPNVFEYIPLKLKNNKKFLTKLSNNQNIDTILKNKIIEELKKK